MKLYFVPFPAIIHDSHHTNLLLSDAHVCPICVKPYEKRQTIDSYGDFYDIRGVIVCKRCSDSYMYLKRHYNDKKAKEFVYWADKVIDNCDVDLISQYHEYASQNWSIHK